MNPASARWRKLRSDAIVWRATYGSGPVRMVALLMERTMAAATKHSNEHSCPATACFELLGQKWTAYLVWALQGGARRFSELILATPGLSDRMLSVRLKSLEQAGIVTRRQYEQIPPRVEYSLTERGRDLAPVIVEMERWSLRWPAGDSSEVAGGGSQGRHREARHSRRR